MDVGRVGGGLEAQQGHSLWQRGDWADGMEKPVVKFQGDWSGTHGKRRQEVHHSERDLMRRIGYWELGGKGKKGTGRERVIVTMNGYWRFQTNPINAG